MLNKKYIVTSTCLSIYGFTRSVIYDLPKMKFEFVPNSITNFLNLLSKKPFLIIYNETPNEYKEIIYEYLTYCLEKEYVLEIPHEIDKNNFPKLSLEFEFPSIISNLVIKLNASSTINYETIRDVLIATKCYNIQLIFESDFELQNIDVLLKVIGFIGLRSIEVIAPFNLGYSYQSLTDKYKNIAFIFIYSAPKSEFNKSHILGLQQIFSSVNDFEVTHLKSLEFFNVNITLFTESQKHNAYFNRKLYIGAEGEIKNSPLTKNIFGNIHNLKNANEILDIVNAKEFQKHWFIHKGLIDVCKQCEFRHMCVDNRLPLKRNDNEWFMETECNYNPYIAKWKGEEGYKSLVECEIRSDHNKFSLNVDKLNAINQELWED